MGLSTAKQMHSSCYSLIEILQTYSLKITDSFIEGTLLDRNCAGQFFFYLDIPWFLFFKNFPRNLKVNTFARRES